MTGCPNGCARPYNAEIGLVGKTKGKYTVFVGGKLLGTRLAFIHKDLVAFEDIVPTLVPLFTAFKGIADHESFGDFCTDWAMNSCSPSASNTNRSRLISQPIV